MNKPKFTKGEWRLPHFVTAKEPNDCTCKFIFNESYYGSIATIDVTATGEIDDIGNPPIEEAKANAHLICAGPVMFEALKIALMAIPADNVEAYSAVEKAIAKALGKAKS